MKFSRTRESSDAIYCTGYVGGNLRALSKASSCMDYKVEPHRGMVESHSKYSIYVNKIGTQSRYH